MKLPSTSFATAIVLAASLVAAPFATAAESAVALDLRRATPAAAHLVIHARHNPERDYQSAYWAEVCQTIEDEQILNRIMKIITSRMTEDKLNEANAVIDQLDEAVESASMDALAEAQEVVYAQVMQLPMNHHVVLIRMTSEQAAGYEEAANNLLDLVEKWSEGEVAKVQKKVGDAASVSFALPPEVPMRPGFLRVDDVVIFTTNLDLAHECADMLAGNGEPSKFEDPRIAEAMANLPEAEDALIFFDGLAMWDALGEMPDFLRQQGANSDNREDIERISGVIERILNEVAFLDYEATVEFTDGLQNRTASYGKITADAEEKVLYQALASGQPFEDWYDWVPADATNYSLHAGVNLHLIYEWVINFVRDEFPESHAHLAKWEEIQRELDFHVDEDLLQAFSGGSVSITVPVAGPDGAMIPQGVTAMRCDNPERIAELIDRGMAQLTALPPVQAQGIRVVDSQDLEGFKEIQANMLPMLGVRPVFGFDGNWMIVSGSPEAVARLQATRRGEVDSIETSENFQRFDLDSSGPVHSVSYSNIAASVNETADAIEQLGGLAPMILGMAGAQADPEDLAPINEALAILPSIAKVVRKFDFMEDRLSITRAGELEGTYRTEAVMFIRDPDANSE